MKRYKAFNFESDLDTAIRMHGDSVERALKAQLSGAQSLCAQAMEGSFNALSDLPKVFKLICQLKEKTNKGKWASFANGGGS